MTQYLPDNASLENLKNQAKSLLKRIHAGEPDVVAQIRNSHSRFDATDLQDFKLADCQLLLALHYGFNNWAELKTALAPDEDVSDRFLRAAILRYGGVFAKDIEKAKQFVREHPDLKDANIWTAAALGNVAAVDRLLNEQPSLVNAKGGPYKDSPLLTLCYSRIELDDSDPIATAELLLQRGADANARYLTHGTYVFTCLTGAIGEGENGPVVCPPHAQAKELAIRLLEHGANPNDGQGLYNSMFTGGTHWLQLLLDYGLKQGDPINWAERDGVTTLDYLLAHAAKRNMIDRVELLLRHNADPNCIDWYDKKPVYELALANGNTRVVELLVEHGATPIEPSTPQQAFYNACMAVDRDTVDQLVSNHPNNEVQSWIRESRTHLALAAEAGKADAVRYMLELGFPVCHALFDAAWHGHLEIARLLVAAGAEASLRHPDHGVTPIAFADRAGHKDVVKFLMEQPIDIFDAVRFGDVARVKAVLADHPEAIEHRYRDYLLPETRADWSQHTPVIHAVVTQRDENACMLLDAGADPTIQLNGRSLLELATQHNCAMTAQRLSET